MDKKAKDKSELHERIIRCRTDEDDDNNNSLLLHVPLEEVKLAVQWMRERAFEDEERVRDALQMIEVLNPHDFFKAAVLLLWIEADRQKNLPEKEKRYDYAQIIIDKINEIPDGSESVNWGEFFSAEFMCWLVGFLNSVWPFEKLRKPELVITMVGKGSLYDLIELQAEKDFLLLTNIFLPIIKRSKNSMFKSKSLATTSLAFAQNGYIEEAKIILKTAVSESEGIKNEFEYSRSQVFVRIAMAFACIGDFDSAVKMADNIQSDCYKSTAYANIAKEYINLGNTDKAEELLESVLKNINEIIRIQGLLWEDIFLPEIAEIFASTGDYESACSVADNFDLDEYSRAIAYSKIIAALANRGDADKAQEIFEAAIIDPYRG